MTGWNDSEITMMACDKLDRADYAVRTAALIAENHATEASTVYGLTGPWGSGKTSLINMVGEELEKTHSTWTVARFTPWATSDVTGMLGDFYASLANALPERNDKLRSAFASMLAIASPFAGLLPVGGTALEKAASTTAELLTKGKPWKETFTEAAAELQELGLSVLVVVDDVDRLQADELQVLLKVIRLLGRFPGVDYLLAYDEETLFSTLSTTGLAAGSGTAARFMEKIVQYPLVLPPLLPHVIETLLRDGIARILERSGRPDPDELRFEPLIALLKAYLTTPRAISRYLAQVQHHLPTLDTAEVDDCDVMGLTFLRMQYSTLYIRLPGLRLELTSGHTGEIAWADGQPQFTPFDPGELLASVPENSRSAAGRALNLLFPRLVRDDSIADPDVRKGIGDVAYFDRYFALRVPTNDVSDRVVNAAIDAAADGHPTQLRRLVMEEPEVARAELVISKAISLEGDGGVSQSGDRRQLDLLRVLIPMLEDLPSGSEKFERIRLLVRRWMNAALLMLSPDVGSTAVLDAVCVARTPVSMLAVFRDERGRMADRPWFDAVVADVERRSIDAVTANLRARDTASYSDQPRFVIRALAELGRGAGVATAIEQGIASKDFTIADVAARFVEIGWSSEAHRDEAGILGFDQRLFDYCVPAASDPWYDSTVEDVDLSDTSWASRRRYAAGRARAGDVRSNDEDDNSAEQ